MAEQDNPRMRASDADREAVAERLRAAQAEGRLDLTEYDERLRATYAAVTHADLAPLTADLPAEAPPAETKKRPLARRSGLPPEWRHYARTAFVLIGIWGVTSLAGGGAVFFWPIFPLGIWGMILLSHSLFGHRPPAGRDRHCGHDS